MTCYIHRDATNVLVGPFRSANAAYEHREEIREIYGTGNKGRPRHAGTIISLEEAILLAVRRPSLIRTTPEEDLRVLLCEPERAA